MSKVKFSSFNVRGLNSHIKKKCLVEDCRRYGIDLMAIQETKIAEGCDMMIDGYRLISIEAKCRHYGNGFVIAPRMVDRVHRFAKISERVSILQIKVSECQGGKIMSFISGYGPTMQRVQKDEDEAEAFYSDLDRALKFSQSDLHFIGADFNSKLGQRREGEEMFMGKHCRGHRNSNGDFMARFMIENDMFAANTAFDHRARHRTSWTGKRRIMATSKLVPIFNQIDYILCPGSKKGMLVNARSYGGATVISDHKVVVAEFDFNRLFSI